MGRSVALRLAQENVHCILVGRTGSKVQAVADEIRAAGMPDVTAHETDVAVLAQVKALKAAIEAVHPVLDILINCAGEAFIRPFEETAEDDFDHVMAMNLKAPYLMAQAFLPLLRQSANASIINISSKVGLKSYAGGVTAYTAAKSGLVGFSHSLASELTEDEIRVVAVCPAPVDTPMRHSATPDFDRKTVIQPEAVAQLIAAVVNLPRGTTSGDILLQNGRYDW